MYRFLFLFFILAVAGGCITSDLEFSDKKQVVPQTYNESVETSSESLTLVNEVYQDTEGRDVLRLGQYGFELMNLESNLTVSKILTRGISQIVQLKEGDILIKINGQLTQKLHGNLTAIMAIFDDELTKTLIYKRGDTNYQLYLNPFIDFDFNGDFNRELFYYYSLNNPYQSELVVLNVFTNDVVYSLDVNKSLSFIPNIENRHAELITIDDFYDHNGTGMAELLLIYNDEKKKIKKNILLSLDTHSFKVMTLLDKSGNTVPAAFDTKEAIFSANYLEFFRLSSNMSEEIIYWGFYYTEIDKSDLKIFADVYEYKDGQYQYSVVLSGQYERQKLMELMGK